MKKIFSLFISLIFISSSFFAIPLNYVEADTLPIALGLNFSGSLSTATGAVKPSATSLLSTNALSLYQQNPSNPEKITLNYNLDPSGIVNAGNAVDMVLLIDQSSSMGLATDANSKISKSKLAASNFVDQLSFSASNKIAVVPYQDIAYKTKSSLVDLTSSNADSIKSDIDKIQNQNSSGNSNLQEALLVAQDLLKEDTRTNVNKAVVVLTDGYSTVYNNVWNLLPSGQNKYEASSGYNNWYKIKDTVAPSAPNELTSTLQAKNKISLSWAPSTDNVGVTKYNIFRNGGFIGTSTTTRYTDTYLQSSKAYTYTVKACDAANNVSAASSSLSVSTTNGITNNSLTIYYKRGYDTPFIVCLPDGGTQWTNMSMLDSEVSGYSKVTIDLGTATSLKASFNGGDISNSDNNGGQNYTFDYTSSKGICTFTPAEGSVEAKITSGTPSLPAGSLTAARDKALEQAANMYTQDSIKTYAIGLAQSPDLDENYLINLVDTAHGNGDYRYSNNPDDLTSFYTQLSNKILSDVKVTKFADVTIKQVLPEGCKVHLNGSSPDASSGMTTTVSADGTTVTMHLSDIIFQSADIAQFTKYLNIDVTHPGVFNLSATLTFTNITGDSQTKTVNFTTLKVYPKIKVLYVHGKGYGGELINTTSVDVDDYTIENFISKTLLCLNGNYDAIYFGKGVYISKGDSRNTGGTIANYDTNLNKLLTGIKSGKSAADDDSIALAQSNRLISPYDITDKMAARVKEFIDSKQMVIFNNDTTNGVFAANDGTSSYPSGDSRITNFMKYFAGINTQGTNLSNYDALKSNLVWNTSSLTSNQLQAVYEKVGKHRPYVSVLSKPVTNPTNNLTNTTDSSQNTFMYTPSNNILNFKLAAYNYNDNQNLTVKLLMDKNADSKYDESNGELVRTWYMPTGQVRNFTYPMPDEYMGRQFWKIVVSDSANEKYEYIDSFLFKGSKPIKMRVLQILPMGTDNPGNYPAAESSNLRNLFNITNANIPMPIGKIEGMFEINVDPVTAYDFNNNATQILTKNNTFTNYVLDRQDNMIDSNGNITTNTTNAVMFTRGVRDRLALGYYDMVIVGFSDSYNKGVAFNSDSLTAIQNFINTNQGVMFSHDNIQGQYNGAGQNIEMRNAFLDDVGLKWQSTVYSKNGVGDWSSNNSIIRQEKGAAYDFNSNAKSQVIKVNNGVITSFPYMLDTLHPSTPGVINVSLTYIQYYRLNLEEADPWYNMYDSSPNSSSTFLDNDDAMNDYYTYSYRNITVSGTGHNPNNFLTSPDELKLFANTILKTYSGGNHPPMAIIKNPVDGQTVPASNPVLNNVKVMASDYDSNDDYVWVKGWIDKNARKDAIASTVDPEDTTNANYHWEDLNIRRTQELKDSIIVDTNDDGVADAYPVDVTADGYIKIPNGDTIILDINKDLPAIGSTDEARNFFLTFKVKDQAGKSSQSTSKVIDNNGPMLDMNPDSTVENNLGTETDINSQMVASGQYRIKNTVPILMKDVKLQLKVYKNDGSGNYINTDTNDVEIPVAETNMTNTTVLGDTMSYEVTDPQQIKYIMDPAGNYDTNTCYPDPATSSWNLGYQLKFKNKGQYKITYTYSYSLGSDESEQCPPGISKIDSYPVGPISKTNTTIVTIDDAMSLSNITLSPSSVTLKDGGTSVISLEFKIGSDITDPNLLFGLTQNGSDFKIRGANIYKKGASYTSAVIDSTNLGHQNLKINGSLTANDKNDVNDKYKINITIEGDLGLSVTSKYIQNALRFYELDYKDPQTNNNKTISLINIDTDTGDLADKQYLPDYVVNPVGGASPSNIIKFLVYKKIKLGEILNSQNWSIQ